MMNDKPNKEQVKEAATTLLVHYGDKLVKWLRAKFPKAFGIISAVVICVVGGGITYFTIGASGQDPIDFVFGILSEKSAEIQTNEVIEISYSDTNCLYSTISDKTNVVELIEYKKGE